jgi:hypothetical protein
MGNFERRLAQLEKRIDVNPRDELTFAQKEGMIVLVKAELQRRTGVCEIDVEAIAAAEALIPKELLRRILDWYSARSE